MPKPHVQLKTDGSAVVRWTDSFQNFVAHFGQGTGNVASGGHYGFRPITRNRLELEWCYRGSWIAGKAVDSVAEDMTREGVQIRGKLKPDKISEMERRNRQMQVWQAVKECIQWARLYGGSLGWLMIDGQDPATPLRYETLRQGQFKGVLPMDRWLVQPTLSPNELISEYGPDYGYPMFYDTVTDTNSGMPRKRIHYSRVIRFDGIKLPYWQRITENLWGQSTLERLWDRMVAFDSVTTGAAQLVYKAHLRTYSVEGLRKIIALGGPAYQALLQQVSAIRALQSIEGITLMDASDKFEVNTYTFAGLDSIMLQFGQQLAGALDIPLVRLFGTSPGGLNATGESDMSIYRSGIKQRQESGLRPGIEKLYRVQHINVFGSDIDPSFETEFRAIDQPTEKEQAEITRETTGAINDSYESGMIDRPTALNELRTLARITGAFSTITDEMIDEAKKELDESKKLAPSPQELGLEGQPGTAKPDQDRTGRPQLRSVA